MDNNEKKHNKASRRIFFASFISVCLIIAVVGTMFSYWVQIYNNVKETEKLSSQYDELLTEESNLKSEVNKLQDPDYIARYARENYLYSKDGEKIIRVVE